MKRTQPPRFDPRARREGNRGASWPWTAVCFASRCSFRLRRPSSDRPATQSAVTKLHGGCGMWDSSDCMVGAGVGENLGCAAMSLASRCCLRPFRLALDRPTTQRAFTKLHGGSVDGCGEQHATPRWAWGVGLRKSRCSDALTAQDCHVKGEETRGLSPGTRWHTSHAHNSHVLGCSPMPRRPSISQRAVLMPGPRLVSSRCTVSAKSGPGCLAGGRGVLKGREMTLKVLPGLPRAQGVGRMQAFHAALAASRPHSPENMCALRSRTSAHGFIAAWGRTAQCTLLQCTRMSHEHTAAAAASS